jgi:CelD/BcsL family acetyltransferase involved in cellulose biosynthesis
VIVVDERAPDAPLRLGYGTFFDSPAWNQLIAETHGHPDRTRMYKFDDGCEARLPLSELPRRWRIVREFISTVHGYGGPVGDDLVRHPWHVREIARDLAADCRRGTVFHLVEDPTPALVDGETPLLRVLLEAGLASDRFLGFSHVLPLDPDFDAVWRLRFDKKARNQYRKAVESGVQVRTSRRTEDLQAFYRLYESSAQRWDLAEPPFPLSFYERMCDLAAGQLTIWLAEDPEGRPIAASLCLYQAGHAFLWASALDKAAARLRPNDLLYGEMIRDACQRGCRVFDFGSGEGLASVQAFKEQFGAQRVDVTHHLVGHPAILFVRRMLGRKRGLR